MQQTQVLVVGGSLVGLSAALFLAANDIPAITIERHAGSSPHPRAIGFTTRTMELLRSVGLGGKVTAVPADFRLRRARVSSLAGGAIGESDWTPARSDPVDQARGKKAPPASPAGAAAIAQDELEPLIRSRATELGADIRQSTELLSFEQDDAAVTARVRHRVSGRETTIRARYMIAADGGDSMIRETLGMTRTGRGHMRFVRSVLFRADLRDYLASGFLQWEIEQPDLKAFLTAYPDGRWVLMFTDDIERGPADLKAAIHKAIGRDDLAVEIITTGRWDLTALVADRFSSGRVFLAGDAAHQLPPTRGGYGANTGIHDVHNLAWKLKAVLEGNAAPALLDTYDAERRPVAWTRHEQIFARPDYANEAKGWSQGLAIIDDEAMELGQLYRSAAVIGAGDDLPAALRPDEWAGQPGTRAPHVWIERGGERISTLDLFQHGWVLLSGDAGWCDAAAAATARFGITLTCHPVDAPGFAASFGIGPTGASLIRPDGVVAWRACTMPDAPAAALTAALRQLLASFALPLRSLTAQAR
jgi:2-polyprenyl-6-methoxyphenol hydroxylase-like FAD-dependent oxidoreductase